MKEVRSNAWCSRIFGCDVRWHEIEKVKKKNKKKRKVNFTNNFTTAKYTEHGRNNAGNEIYSKTNKRANAATY